MNYFGGSSATEGENKQESFFFFFFFTEMIKKEPTVGPVGLDSWLVPHK